MRSAVPTSDLKSSDLALAESVFFTSPCSSSSLLIDGVLPFDNERTAGGATVTRKKVHCFPLNSSSGRLKKGSVEAFIRFSDEGIAAMEG